MALKLRLLGELCVAIAAYLAVRIRAAMLRIPAQPRWGHAWTFLAALGVGMVIGAGFGQWTPSEDQANLDDHGVSPPIVIDSGQDAFELAIEDSRSPKIARQSANSTSSPEGGRDHGFTPTFPEDFSESLPIQRNWDATAVLPSKSSQSTIEESPHVPAWRRFAVPANYPPNAALIAIVVDDLGVNVRNAARTIALQGPLTLAFMSYASNLQAQTETARAAGHELMLHVPMEPQDHAEDPGPNVLLTRLSPEENLRRLRWALGRFEGYVGVNNHMGSRFTQDEEGMELVMNELSSRGLMFLDSRTVRGSVSGRVARLYGVPFLGRDVFLDNVPVAGDVRARLHELETIARNHGRAVGIAHPHRGTLEALAAWLPGLESRGFALVPLSAFLRQSPGSG